MGESLWDEVLLLLIGVAIDIAVAALCFLSVPLWNCLMRLIMTPDLTAVRENAQDQSLPARAHGVSDVEMGNGYGPAQGGDSVTESELELGIIVNSGEAPKAQVTTDAARGASVPVEMDIPHSQQEEVSLWSCRNVSCVANVPSPDDPTSLGYTVSILEGLTV